LSRSVQRSRPRDAKTSPPERLWASAWAQENIGPPRRAPTWAHARTHRAVWQRSRTQTVGDTHAFEAADRARAMLRAHGPTPPAPHLQYRGSQDVQRSAHVVS